MNTQSTENTVLAPGSARELPKMPGISKAVASGFLFRSWDDEYRKPESEGITAEEYEMLAAWDLEGGLV